MLSLLQAARKPLLITVEKPACALGMLQERLFEATLVISGGAFNLQHQYSACQPVRKRKERKVHR